MVKSSKKTPQQLGKDFEGKVQGVLTDLQRTSKTYCLRLYDTRSAGNYLPSQPGDMVCVHEGRPVLIEVKSSGKVESLSQNRSALTSLFDNEQLAKAKLWVRAGGYASAIFQCQHSKVIEVWDLNYIRDCFNTPRLRADKKQAYLFPKANLKAACLFMLKGRMM